MGIAGLLLLANYMQYIHTNSPTISLRGICKLDETIYGLCVVCKGFDLPVRVGQCWLWCECILLCEECFLCVESDVLLCFVL